MNAGNFISHRVKQITNGLEHRTLRLFAVAIAAWLLIGCGATPPVVQPLVPETETVPPKTEEKAQQKEPPMESINTDPAHRWNLQDLFATDADFDAATKKVETDLPKLAALAGTLGKSPSSLLAGLEALFAVHLDLSRINSYAGQSSDEDVRNAERLERRQRVGRLNTDVSKAMSFVDPEILKVGRKKIDRFLKKEPKLAIYAHFLDDILRRKPHTLDEKGEAIIAATGLLSQTASTLYSILANGDIPWPTITLTDGTEVRIDHAGYARVRTSSVRADRIAAYTAFWAKWKEYEQTVGVSLDSQLKKDLFYSQVRGYDNCLARSLDANKVPESVYHMLIKTTNANLETLHRYLNLRKKMLGLDELRYHDAYPPLVESDLKFPIEKGKQLVLDSSKPLGEEYVNVVAKGFEERWMDTFPRPGKMSGAYSNGSAYDVHPYVLMNFNETYGSVSTLAHEWGHAMHSYLANKAQPLPLANYSIFVAEVASTFNEGLLLDHVLKNAASDEEKLFYLGSALEGLRTTFFRQTMFAEFELEIHTLVEKGEALSGKRLTQIYGDILKRYHGHDKKVMVIDDAYTLEWAYVPHFYYNYYVFKYATSLAAASLFVEDVLQKKEGATERYLNVLKAGGSKYPYELLKEAGVDLATPAPYEALMARMNRIMDQIEEILSRR